MLLSMKKFSVSCRVLFALCLAVLAASCSDDDSDPTVEKSSAKAITSFKFASPAATGTITEAAKTIAVSVPFGTKVTELVPTIVVSEKATVAPNTDVKQDFTKAVTYTVTAEDGSTAAYVVTVTVGAQSGNEPVTLTGISTDEIQAGGDEFYIEGKNFGAYAESQIAITLVGANPSPIKGNARANSTSTKLYFKLPNEIPPGEYTVAVITNGQTVNFKETILVTPPTPIITSISAEQVDEDGEVTITGKFFSAQDNIVFLVQDGYLYPMDITEESTTSITFIASAYVGRYTVLVRTANELDVESTQELVVGTLPEITGINKTTFTTSEKLVVTGKGLNVDDQFAEAMFFNQAGGNGIATSKYAKANAEGTEISFGLPGTAGTYSVDIYVAGELIKTYENIVVTN
jgi:hypothetical protein